MVVVTERDCAGVAGGEQLVLAATAAIPDRPDRMDHVLRRQPISPGDLGAAGLAATEGAAFGEELRAGRAMDRAIDAAAAQERRVRGVDDGVNAQCGDVGNNDFQPRRANLARRQAQTAASTAMPLSVNSCCNSPAWNISRTMSQPLTNSALT